MPVATPKKSFSCTMRFYWRYVRRYPAYIAVLAFCIPLVVVAYQFIPPLILANALKRLSTGDFVAGQPWQSFGSDIIAYTSLTLIGAMVLWRIVDIAVWKLEGIIIRDIATDIFGKLTNESATFHANHFGGSLVSQTNKTVGSYIRVADTTIFSIIPLIVSLVAASVILAPQAPLVVVFLLLFAIGYIVLSIHVSKPVREAGAVHASAESKQTGYLADAITNVMAVKSFSGGGYEKKRFSEVAEHVRSKHRALMRAHQKQMLYFSGSNAIISSAAFALAIVSIVNFKANVGTVFLIFSYTANIVSQLFQFSNQSIRNYNRAIGDAAEMIEIMGQPTEIRDPKHPETLQMRRGEIKFSNVTFSYSEDQKSLFSGLNLKIKPGEKVGLVGHSGSGKTTFTRLLLRFSDIDDGMITIDGQDIRSVKQDDLRSVISYVPQEPLLFHRTIAENIGYGRPEASQKEIEAIAKQANAHDFIVTLPKGYDTLVGERGVKLSGGQKQRVAIARAMLKNAPILVLDEATSALDSESEGLIQDALWKLMEGRTAIVIAHRLSTIQKMDRIIVMDNGSIVEEGSHKDLLYSKGVYAKLWAHQSGGFLDE